MSFWSVLVIYISTSVNHLLIKWTNLCLVILVILKSSLLILDIKPFVTYVANMFLHRQFVIMLMLLEHGVCDNVERSNATERGPWLPGLWAWTFPVSNPISRERVGTEIDVIRLHFGSVSSSSVEEDGSEDTEWETRTSFRKLLVIVQRKANDGLNWHPSSGDWMEKKRQNGDVGGKSEGT